MAIITSNAELTGLQLAEPLSYANTTELVSYEEFAGTVDSLWLMLSAILVFLMQAGFALLETGSVRAKNAKNIMIKNLMDACAAAFIWWAIGFPFAYGTGPGGGNPFIGASGFFFINDYVDCSSDTEGVDAVCLYPKGPSIDSFAGWLFQWAFAATAATIVSGAVAERCRFTAYMIYTCVLTGFIYPVVVHWVWSGNGFLSAFKGEGTPGAWLGGMGMVDFAGSGVVHMTGGLAAAVAAAFLGPRIGRFDADGNTLDMPGHNMALVGLGGLLLWTGFYGFNAGSTLGLSGGFYLVAEKVAVNTTLAAGAGGLGAVVMMFATCGFVDVGPLVNGAIGGMVAICSGVAVVEPWAAFVIGFFSVLPLFGWSWLMKKVKIDDPLDASALHYACGFFGLLCGGLFGTRFNTDVAYGPQQGCGGFMRGCNGDQFWVNLVGGIVITAWVGGTCAMLFAALKFSGLFRVPEDEELAGMDVSHHGGSAYEKSTEATEPETEAKEV